VRTSVGRHEGNDVIGLEHDAGEVEDEGGALTIGQTRVQQALGAVAPLIHHHLPVEQS
jgi:hypothetical protein